MLLTRPYPDIEETLQSYVIRLARFNHYKFEHWSQHLSQLGISLRSSDIQSRKCLTEYLYQATGMENVYKLFDPWQFYNKDKRHFDYKAIKVCPTCFTDNKGKLKPLWALRYMVACPEHKCLLADECTACYNPLTEWAIHSGKCESCGLGIGSFTIENIEVDYFSELLFAEAKNGLFENADKLILRSMSQYRSIEAYSFLVYNDIQPLRRQKRGYSIKNKHKHQSAIGQLLQSDELLLNAFTGYIESSRKQGINDVGNALLKFNRYLNIEDFPQITQVIRTLINNSHLVQQQTVGVIWLSKLFAVEPKKFKQYVQQHFPSSLFNKSIPVSKAGDIMSKFIEGTC